MSEISFKYEMTGTNGTTKGDATLQELSIALGKAVKKDASTILSLKEARFDGSVIKSKQKLETVSVMISLVAEQIALQKKKKKDPLRESLRRILSSPKKRAKLVAELELPDLEKGDILMVGKFKNRAAEITDFETDEHGQPVAKTTKGDQKIFKPRVAKLMPGMQKKDDKPAAPAPQR